ncbi:MAG: S-layer homology domain-containing protein [Chloroflexota bacterium]
MADNHPPISVGATTAGAASSVRRGFVALTILCALALVWLVPGYAHASQSGVKDTALLDATPQALTPVATSTATVTPVHEQSGEVWERAALGALAETLGWPSGVSEDNEGKLSIVLELPNGSLARAFVRPFDYVAAAQAALDADREDSQIAGLQIEATDFYSYSAYLGTLPAGSGPAQRVLHWVADRWVMGVDLVGTGDVVDSLDVREIGTRLLSSAVQQGLPQPPGGVFPSPEPTYATTPSATPTSTACGVAFTDVDSAHWAFQYINELACSGIVGGYIDGTFRPQNSTTRAHMAKMIVLSENWALANPATPTFKDVDSSHLFYRYIETAVAHGVVSGYSGSRYRPDAFVSRAQVAKMLVKARGWSLTAQTPALLCDVPTSHWAWSYIQTAIEHSAFAGYANGCFYPDAVATRAQIAKVLVLAHR